MSVLRTNYCINPSCTTTAGYTTTSNCSGSVISGRYTATWTVNSSSGQGVNCATSLVPVAIAIGYQFTISMDVISSKNTTIQLGSFLKDNSGTTIAGTNSAGYFPVVAGVSQRLTATTLASPSAAATGSVYFYCSMTTTSGGSYGVIGDTLSVDSVLCERGTSVTGYFSGDTVLHENIAYKWTGTPNASTSQEIVALPTVTSTPFPDFDPVPRVGLTVDGLLTGDTIYTVWRTADGRRSAVRGARNRTAIDSDYVIDSEAPLGRPVTYDVEVIYGLNVGVATTPDTVTIDSPCGAIQDPLIANTAVKLYGDLGPTGEAGLDDEAIKEITFESTVTMLRIMGADEPIALIGQRQAGSGISFQMTTGNSTHAADLLSLMRQSGLVLIRLLPEWSAALPGSSYVAAPKVVQLPQNEAWGGNVIHWSMVGDLVASPSMNTLVAVTTYGTVAALWTTYQQAQTTLASKTYLDVLRSPSGS